MSDSPWIFDAGETTFDADVIERSKQVPVVLDFWAPWCGPCMRLAPVLKKLVEEYAGKFVLVKANIDETPAAATAFNVYSIPTIFALVGGEKVDTFVGPKPESELRAWIDSILPSPAQNLFREGEALASSDPAAAEAKYREALALAPLESTWKEALALVVLKQGRFDDAHDLLADLEARGLLSSLGEQTAAAIKLKRQSAAAGDVETCRAALAAEPKNQQLRLRLAEALIGKGNWSEAFDLCLLVVQTDVGPARDKAKDLMVEGFQVLGHADPRTVDYRRRLSASLY